jgi:hypothetical protein
VADECASQTLHCDCKKLLGKRRFADTGFADQHEQRPV